MALPRSPQDPDPIVTLTSRLALAQENMEWEERNLERSEDEAQASRSQIALLKAVIATHKLAIQVLSK